MVAKNRCRNCVNQFIEFQSLLSFSHVKRTWPLRKFNKCKYLTSFSKLLQDDAIWMPTLEKISSDLAGWYIFFYNFSWGFQKYIFFQDWTHPVDAQLLPGLPAQFWWATRLGRDCGQLGVSNLGKIISLESSWKIIQNM